MKSNILMQFQGYKDKTMSTIAQAVERWEFSYTISIIRKIYDKNIGLQSKPNCIRNVPTKSIPVFLRYELHETKIFIAFIFVSQHCAQPMLLLLLLSLFSLVRLCATQQRAAHQAPRSLGFSRQEHWSGLPFPSPVPSPQDMFNKCCLNEHNLLINQR